MAAYLGMVSGYESIQLKDLVPQGNPFTADAGHNGYTWDEASKDYGFDTEGIDGTILMSEGFINSGSGVYMPMINVAERDGSPTSVPEELPHLMVYKDGQFVEARYDVKTASFQPAANGTPIDPNALTLSGPVTEISDYALDREFMEVPHHYKPFTLPGEKTFLGELFTPVTLPVMGLVALAKSIGFCGVDMDSFYGQVKAHFTSQGMLMRTLTDGTRHEGWITADQINSFSSASYDEVGQVVREIGKENWIDSKLNRFLLQKALQEKEGNFIVGNPEGDGWTMHIPLAPVKIWKP